MLHKVFMTVAYFVIVLVFRAAANEAGYYDGIVSETNNRTGKFFSLFTVIRFKNVECTSSTNYTGTCLTSGECKSEGGTSAGTCASGFGVCCVFTLSSCGSTTSRNCTYITSPSSLTTTQNCMYTINKCSSSVCQIRLDYYSLTLADPQTTTECSIDKFVVTGGASAIPTICGQRNNGQHVYIDVYSQPSIKLQFLIDASYSLTRSWRIKATQLPCDSLVAAPPSCLQYYTGVSGTIKSFNYDTDPAATGANRGLHLANQDYNICFRTERNYCSICYTACPDIPSDERFSVSAFIATPELPTVLCADDYLLIPGSYNQGFAADPKMNTDRVCGVFFNAVLTDPTHSTVCTTKKPFFIHYVTAVDTIDAAAAAIVGFCINYLQYPC